MEDIFKSEDVYLVAAMRTAGHELEGIEWRGQRAVWLFRMDAGLEQAISDFATGKMVVNAARYCELLRDTKRMLYETEPRS